MSQPAVSIQHLSKRFRIGAAEGRFRYGTLRDTLADALASPLRRLRQGRAKASPEQTVWALQDVDLEIQPGEVIGIIGRNGAGKSTLLKILSRITAPTRGRVEIRGRLSSLLEVGTGFHPELTGRENITLNGAILGMTRREIQRRFDAIVEFAEIERFIDTPVKRYSSGMYLRLAFAVAAHLEPEIFLVDEVLAVGDAAFQKKCLGKMDDVARAGRTVVFVSHNMGAVRSLCERVCLLEGGRVIFDGGPAEAISTYMSRGAAASSDGECGVYRHRVDPATMAAAEAHLHEVRLVGSSGRPQSTFEADKPIRVELHYEVNRPIRGLRFNLWILTQEGEIAFCTTDHNFRGDIEYPGLYRSVCVIPGGLLNRRRYVVALDCDLPGVKVLLPTTECLDFVVSGAGNQASYFPEAWPGVVCPHLPWRIEATPAADALGTGAPEPGRVLSSCT